MNEAPPSRAEGVTASSGAPRRVRLKRTLAAIGGLYLVVALTLNLYGLRAPGGTFDAVVVAGCRVMPDGRPSDALRARVERAAALYHDGRAPLIVTTGGVGADAPRSEAAAAAELAMTLGVPEDALRSEERSVSTAENARFAAEVLGPGRRVLVVSEAYHVFRCERVFDHHFAEVQGAGTLGPAWATLKGSLREVAVLVVYLAIGLA